MSDVSFSPATAVTGGPPPAAPPANNQAAARTPRTESAPAGTTPAPKAFKQALAHAQAPAETHTAGAETPDKQPAEAEPAPTEAAGLAALALLLSLAAAQNTPAASANPTAPEAASNQASAALDPAPASAQTGAAATTTPAQLAADAKPVLDTKTPADARPAIDFKALVDAGAKSATAPQTEAGQAPQTANAPAKSNPDLAAALTKSQTHADVVTTSAAALKLQAQTQPPDTTSPAPKTELAASLKLGAPPVAPVIIEPARSAEAHPTAPAGLSPEIVLPQIVRGLESLSKSGQTALHLQLQPETLGRIELHVSTTSEGMRVTMTADSAATGALLERNLKDLRQTLTDSGMTVAGLSVGIGNNQAGGAFAWQRPNPAPRLTQALAEPLEAVAAATPLTAGGAAPNGRVDYRI